MHFTRLVPQPSDVISTIRARQIRAFAEALRSATIAFRWIRSVELTLNLDTGAHPADSHFTEITGTLNQFLKCPDFIHQNSSRSNGGSRKTAGHPVGDFVANASELKDAKNVASA